MKIRRLSKDGALKIHIEDADDYQLTRYNGVDVWLTPEQVKRIARYAK